MSTGHANSARDMLMRLETMILMGMDLPIPAIRGQLASGIDLVVHLGRLRDRSRKLLEVAEVMGIKNGQIELSTLYRFTETGEKNEKVVGVWKKEEELFLFSHMALMVFVMAWQLLLYYLACPIFLGV